MEDILWRQLATYLHVIHFRISHELFEPDCMAIAQPHRKTRCWTEHILFFLTSISYITSVQKQNSIDCRKLYLSVNKYYDENYRFFFISYFIFLPGSNSSKRLFVKKGIGYVFARSLDLYRAYRQALYVIQCRHCLNKTCKQR